MLSSMGAGGKRSLDEELDMAGNTEHESSPRSLPFDILCQILTSQCEGPFQSMSGQPTSIGAENFHSSMMSLFGDGASVTIQSALGILGQGQGSLATGLGALQSQFQSASQILSASQNQGYASLGPAAVETSVVVPPGSYGVQMSSTSITNTAANNIPGGNGSSTSQEIGILLSGCQVWIACIAFAFQNEIRSV
jgi:hypothetical protein